MKRSVLLLFALGLLLLPVRADAQVRGSVGIKGGLNISTLRTDLDDVRNVDLSSESRMVGGLFYLLNLRGPLDLQVEALYTQKGTDIELEGFAIEGVGDLNLTINAEVDYVEFPLLVKLRLPLGGFLPAVYGGGAYAIKVQEDVSGIPDAFLDDEDLFEDTDVSVLGGVAFDVNVPVLGILTLDARYTLGVNELELPGLLAQAIENETNVDPDDIRNGVFSLTLGLGL